MSRVQLALRVSDLDGSIAFSSSLFGVQPAKRRPGYANFAITEPPLKLVLIEGDAPDATSIRPVGVSPEAAGRCECGQPATAAGPAEACCGSSG